jgi:hypothetical protein
VWLYHMFSLRVCDVELILTAIVVAHESIRHRCLKFGADIADDCAVADRSQAI